MMKLLVVLLALVALVTAISVRQSEGKYRTLVAQPFKFNACDGAKGAVVTALNVAPSPIVLGKNITLKGAVKVNAPLNAKTISAVSLTIKKKILGAYVEIPCIEKVGSCTYQTNLCDDLAKNKQQICAILQPLGLPCQCPFSAGTYAGPSDGITVPTNDPGLDWATDGDFYAKVVLTGSAGEYACTEVYLSLSNK